MKGIINPNFKKQVAALPDGANLMNCYLCGSCTAGCPVSELDPNYSPRTIMRLALLGMKDQLLASPDIWKCSQCNRCSAHCPQNARPADVIKALRDLSVSLGCTSEISAGKFAQIEDEINALRLDKIGAVLNELEK